MHGNSVANHFASAFASSVAATESRPAAINGEFAAMAVPSTSMSDAEMVVLREIVYGLDTAFRHIMLHEFSRGLEFPQFIVKEPAMDCSDGWSNSSIDGSSVSRRLLSRAESSVAPMESSPANMRGTSNEMAVPVRLAAMPTSSSWSPSSRVRLCACAIPCCAEGRTGCVLESTWLGLAREAVANAGRRLSYEMRRL